MVKIIPSDVVHLLIKQAEKSKDDLTLVLCEDCGYLDLNSIDMSCGDVWCCPKCGVAEGIYLENWKNGGFESMPLGAKNEFDAIYEGLKNIPKNMTDEIPFNKHIDDADALVIYKENGIYKSKGLWWNR